MLQTIILLPFVTYRTRRSYSVFHKITYRITILKQPIGFEFKYYSRFHILTVLYFEILVTIWNTEKWSLKLFLGGRKMEGSLLPHLGPIWPVSVIKERSGEAEMVVKTRHTGHT